MKMCCGMEVQLYCSWPQHQMEVSGQLHAPPSFPSDMRLSLDRVENTLLAPAGNRSLIVQPIAGRYTD
jgi:hypothetical protein